MEPQEGEIIMVSFDVASLHQDTDPGGYASHPLPPNTG